MPAFYEISLSLPPSINASHSVGRGHKDPKTGKWQRVKFRSSEYKEWIKIANLEYRSQFPVGVHAPFKGRVSVHYIFIWTLLSKDATGRLTGDTSDISNREKVLSDFLQGKFFDNDNQIDEQHHYRRFVANGKNKVIVRIYETKDKRHEDFNFIFNPQKS